VIPLLTALLAALAEGCKAYCARVAWEMATHKEETRNAYEDEMDALAADGSPAAKLRLERLNQRKQRLGQP